MQCHGERDHRRRDGEDEDLHKREPRLLNLTVWRGQRQKADRPNCDVHSAQERHRGSRNQPEAQG